MNDDFAWMSDCTHSEIVDQYKAVHAERDSLQSQLALAVKVVEAVRGKPKVTYTDKDPAALIRYLLDLDAALADYDSATERESEPPPNGDCATHDGFHAKRPDCLRWKELVE